MIEQAVAMLRASLASTPSTRICKYSVPIETERADAEIDFYGPKRSPCQRIVRTSRNVASGAVTCMAAAPPDAGASGFSVLVGACCSQRPEYNRGGELQYFCHDGEGVLDGHWAPSSRQERRTVSHVIHDGQELFHSAGYDGAICGWRPGGGGGGFTKAYHKYVCTKSVLDIAALGNGNLLYGTSAGQLCVYSHKTDAITVLNSLPPSNKPGVNWIDCVKALPSRNRFFAGTGWCSATRSGVLEAWDLDRPEAPQTVARLPGDIGLSAFSCSQDYAVIGSGSVLHSSKLVLGDCVVRVFDTRTLEGVFQLTTCHADVEAIEQSPCGRLLAIGDSLDHRYSVYDLCNPKSPIYSSSCAPGNTTCDDMICLAFGEDGSLYAGGYDSVLYKLDIAEGRIDYALQMASSITCILPTGRKASCKQPDVAVGSEGGAVQFVGHEITG